MDTRKVAHELRQQHWSEILNQRQASGQTVRQICQERGIKEKTYYYWQRKLGKAVYYSLNQWEYLTRYLLDGRLEISNNRAERSIRPFVIGRKNFIILPSILS